MKNIFTSVINKGGYDLTQLLTKIDAYHVEGKLTDTEREELYAAARKTPIAQYNQTDEINALWAAIRALQAKEETGNTDTTVAEYKQPTGAHDAYQVGDKVLFNGAIYSCLQHNCVWSPAVLPSAWEKAN